MKSSGEYFNYTVTNSAVTSKINPLNDNDIYRLSVSVEGEGWDAQLPNSLASIRQGDSKQIQVYVSHSEKCSDSANVIFTVRSENDPGVFKTTKHFIYR
jgi:hypothetical protein